MARILIVGKYYPPFSGGIENYTAYVAEKLAERHEVVALVSNHRPGPGSQEQRNGVTVIRRRLLAIIKSQPIYLGIFSRIRLADFDVIHFMAPNPYANLFLLLAGFRQGGLPPLVITHNMDIYGRKLLRAMAQPLYDNLLKRSRGVIGHF